jgi:hypothetical protein
MRYVVELASLLVAYNVVQNPDNKHLVRCVVQSNSCVLMLAVHLMQCHAAV